MCRMVLFFTYVHLFGLEGRLTNDPKCARPNAIHHAIIRDVEEFTGQQLQQPVLAGTHLEGSFAEQWDDMYIGRMIDI